MDLVRGGGMDSRGGYVSKILYVKTKDRGSRFDFSSLSTVQRTG